ncbi:MAG: ABC transporter permease subunit [Chloroflexi bacterium]|nr:ABC transporter permease subunit [Chloroflexota bacterium]
MRAMTRKLALLVIFIGVLLPLLPLVVWSWAHRWYFPAVLPTEWSGRAWAYVVGPGSQVLEALGNSVLVAAAVTLLSILIGLPAGRALGMHQFRGKTVVQFLILAPTIMPVLAVAMGIHVAFIRYGLADSLLGVILVHLVPVTPYMVLILASVFANYNPDVEGQARSLGARPRQVLWHITLPAILPGLVVGSLFAFIISWSQYLLTLLIGGRNVITLPILLFSFANAGDNAITAALSIVFVAPTLIFLLLMSRYLTGQSAALGGFGKV